MTTFTVGVLKSNFSKVIDKVKQGEKITVAYGREKEKVAVIIPYSQYLKKNKRQLGILENKAKCQIKPNFTLTEEEFLRV